MSDHDEHLHDDVSTAAQTLSECLTLRMERNAAEIAGELFRESFSGNFPQPREVRLGEFVIRPEDWWQAIALYRWPDGREECVGFTNWIKFQTIYLCGALCVKKNFYRRLPRDHFRECRQRGGVAQMVMEFGDATLPPADGWFGHCGDTMAYRVDVRVGFEPTEHPFLIAKWTRPVPAERKQQLTEAVRAIGAF